MTLYEDPQREAPQQHEDEPAPLAEGTVARRATLLTTGLGGASGTLIGLATHGPAGLFFGVLGTAAVLALEYHGTPEEYAAVTRSVRAARRWLARAREQRTTRESQETDVPPTRHPSPYNDVTDDNDEETEPLPWLPDPFGDPAPHDDLFGEEPAEPREQALRFAVSSHFTLSQVLTRFQPTLDRLFLGMLPDGTPIFCAAKDLCHVALAGATGGGKSSILRLLLAQLCAAGASVLLLNPHYTRFDREAEPPEDWTPFEPYLVHDPMACRRYEVIEFYLKQIATELLPNRLDKYARSEPLGKPYFLAIEELPAIVARIKHAPDYLAQIVREGRKVGIFLITVAQDFLVSTIAPGGGGAVRDCYRTAYYVGGDATTARILLDKPARLLPEAELGQGTVLLRCQKVPLVKEARVVLVPYVDNRALYRLLGPSTYVPTTTSAPRGPQPNEVPLEQWRPEQAWREAPPQRQPDTFPSTPAGADRSPVLAPLSSPRATGPRLVPARLQQVAQVYEPGMSLTWLAGQLGVSEQKASIWLKEAKMRGLIGGQKKPQGVEKALEPISAPPIAVPGSAKPAPTLADAVIVWNEAVRAGEKLSRYSLKERLVARGFECGENMARKFLEEIKALVERQKTGSVDR